MYPHIVEHECSSINSSSAHHQLSFPTSSNSRSNESLFPLFQPDPPACPLHGHRAPFPVIPNRLVPLRAQVVRPAIHHRLRGQELKVIYIEREGAIVVLEESPFDVPRERARFALFAVHIRKLEVDPFALDLLVARLEQGDFIFPLRSHERPGVVPFAFGWGEIVIPDQIFDAAAAVLGDAVAVDGFRFDAC